jgi:hypothetical protein
VLLKKPVNVVVVAVFFVCLPSVLPPVFTIIFLMKHTHTLLLLYSYNSCSMQGSNERKINISNDSSFPRNQPTVGGFPALFSYNVVALINYETLP